jgi:hypothetical protein
MSLAAEDVTRVFSYIQGKFDTYIEKFSSQGTLGSLIVDVSGNSALLVTIIIVIVLYLEFH